MHAARCFDAGAVPASARVGFSLKRDWNASGDSAFVSGDGFPAVRESDWLYDANV